MIDIALRKNKALQRVYEFGHRCRCHEKNLAAQYALMLCIPSREDLE